MIQLLKIPKNSSHRGKLFFKRSSSVSKVFKKEVVQTYNSYAGLAGVNISSFFLFENLPLLLYCTTFLFYCSPLFRATNASYVFYMYCVIHLELQSNLQQQKKAFLSIYIYMKPRFYVLFSFSRRKYSI